MAFNRDAFIRDAKREGYTTEVINEFLVKKGYEPISPAEEMVHRVLGIIPPAFTVAGGIGGGLVGGPPGVGVGTFAGYGAGKTIEENLKRLIGIEPMPAKRFVTEVPTTASELGIGAYTLAQLAQLIPRPGAGKRIEEVTTTKKASYPYETYLKEVEEKAARELKTPEGQAAYEELKAIAQKGLEKPGQIGLKGVHDIQVIAGDKAKFQAAPNTARRFWRTVQNISSNIIKGREGLAPELARPYRDYALAQKISRVTAGGTERLLRGAQYGAGGTLIGGTLGYLLGKLLGRW